MKTHVVVGLLAFLTLWPAVQIYLVKRFDLSPWKLAGWGMYSSPRFGFLGMEVYGRSSVDTEWIKLTSPTAEQRAQAGEFLERYRWLRKLARPDDLARSALASHPEWRELRVKVFQPVLDRQSGMVVLKEVSYEYPRV